MAININMGRPENESREHKKAKMAAAALFNNSKDFIAITEFPIIKYNGKLCPATVLFDKIPTFMQIYAKLDELNIHPKYILDCAVFRKEPFELIMDIEIIKSSPVGAEKRKALQTECACAVVEHQSKYTNFNKLNKFVYEPLAKYIHNISKSCEYLANIDISLLEYGYCIAEHIDNNITWRHEASDILINNNEIKNNVITRLNEMNAHRDFKNCSYFPETPLRGLIDINNRLDMQYISIEDIIQIIRKYDFKSGMFVPPRPSLEIIYVVCH